MRANNEPLIGSFLFMLTIKKIIIENIRLIEKIELDLSASNYLTLIGKNNSGKSTILRSIDFFFSAEKKFEDLFPVDGVQPSSVTVDFTFPKNKKAKILELLSLTRQADRFEAKLVESGENYIISIRREITKEESGKIKINDHKVSKTGEDNFENITGLTTNIRRIFPKIIILPSIASVEDYQNAAMKTSNTFEDIFEIYLEGLNWESDPETKEIVEKLQKKISQKLNYEQIESNLLDFGKEVFDELNSIEIKSQFKGVSDLSTILKKVDVDVDDGIKTSIQDKGTGTQRVIILALLRLIGDETINKRDKDCLFILDEPEIHLHPEAQKALARSLVKISLNHKVIIATHSHLLIHKGPSRGIFKKILKENNKTIDMDLQDKNYFEELFSYLGFVPSDFLLPDNIILVEGKWDKLFLEKIIELMTNEGTNEYADLKALKDKFEISIIDIGGDGNVGSAFEFIKDPEHAIDFFKNLPAYSSRFCAFFDNKSAQWITSQRAKVSDVNSPFRVNCISGDDIVYMFPERLIKDYAESLSVEYLNKDSFIAGQMVTDKSTFKRNLSNYVIANMESSDLANIDALIVSIIMLSFKNCDIS